MKSIFYIILITIILITIIILSNYNKKEHFIQRTIQFTDLALNPINVKYHSFDTQSVSKQFFEIVGNFIPLTYDENKQNEIFTDKKSNILYKYLNGNNQHYRFITRLYPKYLTIITGYSNSILTFNNMMNNNTIRDVYILEHNEHKNVQNMLEILFVNKKYNYINIYKFPKILNKNAYYVLFSNEYNKDLTDLAIYNNFVIIEFPENHQIYQKLKLTYQSLIITKYDVSLQMSYNLKKITYAITDYLCLWTYDTVSELKVYTFIKTLFSNIETIRIQYKNDNLKFLFQNMRPEKMIVMSVVPLHNGVIKYFHELKIFTYIEQQICTHNTVTTTNCNPNLLFENRFKLLNLYGTRNNIFL